MPTFVVLRHLITILVTDFNNHDNLTNFLLIQPFDKYPEYFQVEGIGTRQALNSGYLTISFFFNVVLPYSLFYFAWYELISYTEHTHLEHGQARLEPTTSELVGDY